MKFFFYNFKYWLLITFLAHTTLLQSQTIQLIIEAPKEFQTIQFLTYENPFDSNVKLLAEVNSIREGKFQYTIPEIGQLKVAVRLGEATHDLILTSGYWYHITLEVKKLDLRIPTENEYIIVTKAESDNKVFQALYKIEKDIDEIGRINKKSNGKYSSNYSTELFGYWDNLLIKQRNDLETDLVNSRIFATSASIIRKTGTSDQFKLLENLFEKNFSYSAAGFQALTSLYINNLHLDFVFNHLNKIGYIEYVDREVNKIKDLKIKSAVELALIANAVGGKWANQEKVLNKLQSIIDTTPNDQIKEYALAIQALHNSRLIGKEIEDFKTLSIIGDTISFNDFKGKFLLIDFWATWCGPCVKSMRKLPDLKTELNGKLEVLCVTFEIDKEKVGRFIERNNYQSMLKFGFALNKKLIDSYFDIRAIPLYYLVSPEGIILDKAVGEPFEMVKRHVK